MRLKPLLIIASAVAAIVWLAYYFHSENQRSLADQAKSRIDAAVSVLSQGTQEAWVAYVDRRIAVVIQPVDGAIKVSGLVDSVINRTTLISKNTPYQIICSPLFGASVHFGYGANSVTVEIYGSLMVDRGAEPPPPLGVTLSSVANSNLAKILCERITAALKNIMTP